MKSRIIETTGDNGQNVPYTLQKQAKEKIGRDSELASNYYKSFNGDSDDDSAVYVLNQAMAAERDGYFFITTGDDEGFNNYVDKLEYASNAQDIPVLFRAIFKSRVQNLRDRNELHKRNVALNYSLKPQNRTSFGDNIGDQSEGYKKLNNDGADGYLSYLKSELDESERAMKKYKILNAPPYMTARYSEIAPGVCAEINIVDRCPNKIFDRNGREASVAEWQPENSFGLSLQDSRLLRIVHNTRTKNIFISELGVDISKIPLNSQLRFLNFAIEADDSRYGKLKKHLLEYGDDSEKVELINSFLSLEFGDHFGDKLLHIAEKLEKPRALEIFKSINSIRQSAVDISKYFKDTVDHFDTAVYTAWLKRTTELLAVISSDESSSEEIESAISVINILRFASEKVAKSLVSGQFQPLNNEEYGLYGQVVSQSFKSTDDKSEGLWMGLRTADSLFGSNQRIAFNIPIPAGMIPQGQSEENRENILNIRLDYDITYGLSLDIGSKKVEKQKGETKEGYVNASKVGFFVCDMLEKGEQIINGKAVLGHHSAEAFDIFKDQNGATIINTEDFMNKIIKKFGERLGLDTNVYPK